MSCRRIVVDNLTICLADGSRTLVDGLGLALEAGSSLAVVGESGAGKSMTAMAIMRLLPRGITQIGGIIEVSDRDISTLSPAAMRLLRAREVGIIMQNPMSVFDPVFTIESHFRDTAKAAESGAGNRAVRDRATDALAEVGLPDPVGILEAYPFQLSGGMLQRVMIALALLNEPQFLIADEPTTDLDVLSQKRVLDLIKERCVDRHLGLLLITHDLSVAAYMADGMVIMQHGRVVESGSTPRILGEPRDPYTRELVQAHNHLYSSRFASLVNAQGAPA